MKQPGCETLKSKNWVMLYFTKATRSKVRLPGWLISPILQNSEITLMPRFMALSLAMKALGVMSCLVIVALAMILTRICLHWKIAGSGRCRFTDFLMLVLMPHFVIFSPRFRGFAVGVNGHVVIIFNSVCWCWKVIAGICKLWPQRLWTPQKLWFWPGWPA